MYQIISTAFSLEVEFETLETGGKMWAIFVYASNKDRIRAEQRQDLIDKKDHQGDKWILGGDFNDIRKPDEKKSGRIKTEASCKGFKEFIEKIGMDEIAF